MDKMATIKDVAREAGVSVGTISRYLNGAQLKDKNKNAIELAIDKLGYEANSVARNLKTGKSMTVGVIVPRLANMFSMRVIESIERRLQSENYSVVISDCGNNEAAELDRLKFLKRKNVDGFVLMPVGNNANAVKDIVKETPLVLIDRILDQILFDSVVIDNEKMVYENVCHLLATGIKKIGIIEGPTSISTARERSSGYGLALKKYNLKNEYSVRCQAYSYEEGANAMKLLQKEQLEAIFVSNYELSVGAVSANTDDKLKILGFDTLEFPSRFHTNYMGIQQPIEKIGEEAAGLLLERMNVLNRTIRNVVIDT